MHQCTTAIAWLSFSLLTATILPASASAQMSYNFEQENTNAILATLDLSNLPASQVDQIVSLRITSAGSALIGFAEGIYDSAFDVALNLSLNDNGIGELVDESPGGGNAYIDAPAGTANFLSGLILDFELLFADGVSNPSGIRVSFHESDTTLVDLGGVWRAVNRPGDFDADGDIDGADFLKWQRDDGTAEGLTLWQTNYGAAIPLAVSVETVPEPASSLLVAASLLGLLAGRF